MKPRPIYRWKSFWLGLLVVAFLGWAWARATTHYDGVKVDIGGSTTTAILNQTRSSVSLFLRKDRFHASTAVSWVHVKVGGGGGAPSGGFLYRPWSKTRGIGSSASFPSVMEKEIVIAHWMIMILFSVIWGTVLLARWCRMRRVPSVTAKEKDGSI